MYFPSGESCGAAISGLPNSSSRSMMVGSPLVAAFFCSADASVVSSNTRHKTFGYCFHRELPFRLDQAIRASEAELQL